MEGKLENGGEFPEFSHFQKVSAKNGEMGLVKVTGGDQEFGDEDNLRKGLFQGRRAEMALLES